MRKYIVLLICAIIVGSVLATRESHFGYKRNATEGKTPAQVVEAPSMLFVGDIMLGRNVENLMVKYGNNYPFDHIDALLKNEKLVVANLEGPVMKNYVHTPSGSVRFSFPSSTPALLKEHNISIVSIANNHTFDFGASGYAETAQYLNAAGVDHFGHPFAFGTKDQYVLRKEINGKKFTFVGFNATNPSFDTVGATSFVGLQKEEGTTLIVNVHAGNEYELTSSPFQQSLYRGFIEAGADLIIAHHPHVVQEIELYKGKLIFYSLGNFIFDQYFSNDVQEMLGIRATFNASSTDFDIIPLKSVRSQTGVMQDSEKTPFLNKLANRSSESLRAQIVQGNITVSRN